jgi:hypothetical protein
MMEYSGVPIIVDSIDEVWELVAVQLHINHSQRSFNTSEVNISLYGKFFLFHSVFSLITKLFQLHFRF